MITNQDPIDMRVALVSYECPPKTADGGIGTYAWHAGQSLHKMGVDVEIFSASREESSVVYEDGVLVHRVLEVNPKNFKNSVLSVFSQRHQQIEFSVVEGPEFNADAIEIMKKYPELPSVVKLHTPRKLIFDKIARDSSFVSKVRSFLKTGKFIKSFSGYGNISRDDMLEIDEQDVLEMNCAKMANLLISPSSSLAQYVKSTWGLDDIAVLPYPFIPHEKLKKIRSIPGEYVTFFGRLDKYKGFYNFVEALSTHELTNSRLKFRVVGSTQGTPEQENKHKTYLEKTVPNFEKIDFTGRINVADIPNMLEESCVVVIPSHWDNFPFVVIEAMAAARTVIASNVGGIPELLDGGRVGILVPPNNSAAIAKAIVEAVKSRHELELMGSNAREHISELCDATAITKKQIQLYEKAINRCKNLDRPEIR